MLVVYGNSREGLYYRTMGKQYKVRAISDNVDKTNAYLKGVTGKQGVISFSPDLIIVADYEPESNQK